MFVIRIVSLFAVCLIAQLTFAEGAWAWGPAVHTVIASRLLGDTGQILPAIASVMHAFPFEYIYGSLAADFLVGKGFKPKEGHSHNWETGLRFLGQAKSDRERAYAYGFMSHLAADVIAHNYFIPNILHRVSTWKRMGHLFWEARADHAVGPVYIRIAREVLSMERLGCDEMLKEAVGKRGNALKARRRIFTQSVKISDYLSGYPSVDAVNRGLRYQLSPKYLAFMIGLSYRLVKDLLSRPESSPCLSYDPIGARNLYLASRKAVLSKLFPINRPVYRFNVDEELLDI